MKQELEQQARRALRNIESNESSTLAKALDLMNMPKVHFRYTRNVTEFTCIALFDEQRKLIEIELIHPKLSGKITYNKR